jgi:hypothetical protein
MTQPTPFTCSYSFANAFTANLTMVFPGRPLDADLNRRRQFINDLSSEMSNQSLHSQTESPPKKIGYQKFGTGDRRPNTPNTDGDERCFWPQRHANAL